MEVGSPPPLGGVLVDQSSTPHTAKHFGKIEAVRLDALSRLAILSVNDTSKIAWIFHDLGEMPVERRILRGTPLRRWHR